jgi:S-adenosylmethionine uptake transporter
LQFFAWIFGCLVMSIALGYGTSVDIAILVATWPSTNHWLLLGGLGLIATGCHLLVTYAYRLASIGILAPFQYVEIIGATVLGLIIFNEFPDAITWVGVSIIVGSGMYVFHREASLAATTADETARRQNSVALGCEPEKD